MATLNGDICALYWLNLLVNDESSECCLIAVAMDTTIVLFLSGVLWWAGGWPRGRDGSGSRDQTFALRSNRATVPSTALRSIFFGANIGKEMTNIKGKQFETKRANAT